jgi:adenine-specific DNA-methyltransferase
MPTVVQLREKLMNKLKELFQLDQPDLDFGFYRIMHVKSLQVTEFIEKDLLKIVEDAFGAVDEKCKAAAKAEYEAAIETAKQFGAPDPENTQAVKEAKAKFEALKDTASAEAEIYDHLYRFFERYYDTGDFLSRRYTTRETPGKAAPFAIPYNGEEVKLYWANADQYYIKTAEHFTNFTFDLCQAKEVRTMGGELFEEASNGTEPLRVHFKIVDATEGEHGNIKAGNEQTRYFLIHKEKPVELNDQGELVVNFEYCPDPEKTGQEGSWRDKRNAEAVEIVLSILEQMAKSDKAIQEYFHLLKLPAPTDSDKNRPLLAKYIKRYTSRNTMDYFIHKDLGAFLRRELDFYIKNEIMRLDDIENADAPAVETYLVKIKVLRKIAIKLIDFLAQLENFQKKLWLKKKFVVETNYCITLDRVPEELYQEIAANEAQHDEWVKLFAIDEIQRDITNPGYEKPLTVEFLKANNKLVLDTRFFDEDFKARLLASNDDFDEQCNGLMIHSENFQGLNLIQEYYREQIKCIYIDPPYNTGNDDNFTYKDSYQHSTWLSMMYDRTDIVKKLMNDYTPLFCSIDQNEWHELRMLFSMIFGSENYVNEIVWQKLTAAKKQSTYFPNIYEKIMIYRKSSSMELQKIFIESESDDSNYPHTEEDTGRRYGSFDFTQKGQGEARWFGDQLLEPPEGKHWIWSQDKINEGLKNGTIIFTKYGTPRVKRYLDEKEGNVVGDLWIDEEIKPLSANDSERVGFDTQKPLCLLRRVLITSDKAQGNFVLDYFAGSGTTAHAVINLNREDDGNRKYILVEMGEYFDTVMKPRIAKVIYSESWKNGKPTARHTGISHSFKYIRLESYEDTLNNLRFDDNPIRDRAIEAEDSLKEDYMLHYMLDVETRGSQSLLNIDSFTDPTAYKLKVKKPGSDEYCVHYVDLIETFNYLIGLRVVHIAVPQSFTAKFKRIPDPELPQNKNTRLVVDGKIKKSAGGAWWFRKIEGWVPADPANPNNGQREKVLVVWRKLTGDLEKDNVVLDEWFQKNRISTRDFEFDTIYVNGSNNLPNLAQAEDTWKVHLIEEEFFSCMWEGCADG